MFCFTDDPERRASLVALSFLISALPKSVYVSEMSKVCLPYLTGYDILTLPKTFQLTKHLIRGLDLPDAQIRASIFDTFLTVTETASADLSDGQGIIAEHASTLTTAALRNALPHEVTLLYVTGLKFVLLYYILRPLAQSLRISALKLLAGLPQAVRYDILQSPESPRRARAWNGFGRLEARGPQRGYCSKVSESIFSWPTDRT